MVKIKTELEQKIELMDSLRNVKDVVNEAGGSITEDAPYLQYGEKVSKLVKFNLYYPFDVLSDGEDGAFNATWQASGSNDVYVSSFKFEENEDGTYRLTPSGVTKNGKMFGMAKVGAIITPDGEDSTVGSSSLFMPLDGMTRTENAEGDYTYSFNIGDNTANFLFFYGEPESMTNPTYGQGEYLDKDGNTIGSCGIFWLIEELPPAPIQKGSFNASTQQLTLNYDYLVEMINSSTVLTAEQKTTAITELNNSDVVVSMTTSIVPENEYMYGFQSSQLSPQVGLFVDAATPVTLKTTIVANNPSAVISTIGTYKALADFDSSMGGSMTEEQAEAQYAPFVVDENLCTVSGTLGNFSVEFN